MLDDAAVAQHEKNVQGPTRGRHGHELKVRELPLRLFCTGSACLHRLACPSWQDHQVIARHKKFGTFPVPKEFLNYQAKMAKVAAMVKKQPAAEPAKQAAKQAAKKQVVAEPACAAQKPEAVAGVAVDKAAEVPVDKAAAAAAERADPAAAKAEAAVIICLVPVPHRPLGSAWKAQAYAQAAPPPEPRQPGCLRGTSRQLRRKVRSCRATVPLEIATSTIRQESAPRAPAPASSSVSPLPCTCSSISPSPPKSESPHPACPRRP